MWFYNVLRKCGLTRVALWQPPTFREVLDVTLEVVGNTTSHKWIGYLDDALFAMTDLTGAYKSAAEVGLELGKKALTSTVSYGAGAATSALSTAASAALSTASTAANVAAQAGISMTSSYVTSVANSAISSVYINEDGGLDFAGETFGKSLHSTSVIGGALGTGVSAGLNTEISAKLHNLDNGAAINKFYGSAINLGVSAAGKTAEYATYLAYAGGNFSKAYDDMGGLSFNILDAGVFADMIATNKARTNSTGQGGKWGEIAQRLKNSNAGMFEINIGRKGITGKIGQGGMNLAGSLYDFGKRMNDKATLEEYAATHDEKIVSSVMKEYIYGDWTQENAAARLVSGLDDLEVTKAKGFTAKTTSNGHGGRHIVMQDTGNDLNNAVQLGHEAYRNGLTGTTSEQHAETIAAVFGHTNMAANMDSWDAGVDLSGLLGAEVAAYRRGDMNALVADAMINYDSSKDYWKIVMNADGTHSFGYDGKKELTIDYKNENGETISSSTIEDERLESMGWSESLVTVLGSDRAEELLRSSYLNADNYDAQTLKDVLKLDDAQITRIQRKGSLEGVTISESQKKSLLGEVLIKNAGATWNSETKQWDNIGNLNLTVTDAYVGGGNIMAEINTNEKYGEIGKYLYSTVNATVFRDPDSWKSVTNLDGKEENWNKNTQYYGLDYILYEKNGINYDYYSQHLVDKYQTVDNQTSGNSNQPFYTGSNWIQGNTIISGNFNMQYSTKSQYLNDVLVINNANTLGTLPYINYIGNNGNHYYDEGRWLAHDNTKVVDNTAIYYPYQYSDGCFVTTHQSQKELLDILYSWQLAQGYQISTTLINGSYNKIPFGSRKK